MTRAGLAAFLLAACLTLPAPLPAQTPERFATVVGQVMNDLIGNEIDSTFVLTPVRGGESAPSADCPDSTAIRVDIVGFSLCAPADPWAAPVTSPDPGKNAYGCVNAAEVSMSLVPPGFRANMEITVSGFYVDLKTTHDADSAAVTGDGYLLADAVVSMQCDLLEVEGCMRLAPLEPSAAVSLVTRTIEQRDDPCLSARLADDGARAQAQREIEEHLGDALRDLVLARMDVVNEALCGPAVKTQPTWAPVRRRSGAGG